MESLVYQHDISDNCFVEREAFIKFWKNGPFDLYYFGKSDQKNMAGRIQYLYKQLETADLPKHDDIVLPLLLPVDAALPHPKKVREKDRPEPDVNTFYITKEQVFQGVFKVTERVGEELREGMLMLTSMINTKLG